MAHPANADKLLEISGNKLGAVVSDDSGLHPGNLLPGSLDDDLYIGLPHVLSDLPVHHIAAVAIKDRTQVVEGPTNVDIADIYMSVLVWPGGLLEAFSFLRGFSVPSLQQPGGLQDPVGGTGAHRHKIGIQLDAEHLVKKLTYYLMRGRREEDLPTVYIPDAEIWELRGLFTTYQLHKKRKVQMTNRIHSILKQNRICV